MLDCSSDGGHGEALSLLTPSGNNRVRVQSIDYAAETLIVFDSVGMSNCSNLQSSPGGIPQLHWAYIKPDDGNWLFLMNCSGDSPLAGKPICFGSSPGGHSCYELYKACSSFKAIASTAGALPPCCITKYDIVKNMSLKNELKCSHYTSVYDVNESSEGMDPMDWQYGMQLSFATPSGCDACQKSGGTCGYDVVTFGLICLCNSKYNATTECDPSRKGGLSTIAMILIAVAAFVVLGGGAAWVVLKLQATGICNVNCCNKNVNNHNHMNFQTELLQRAPNTFTRQAQSHRYDGERSTPSEAQISGTCSEETPIASRPGRA